MNEATPTIDTFNEDVISIDAGAKHVAKISGKKPNRRQLVRWSNRGVSGLRLPTIQIGSELYTSREKLNWFLNAIRQVKQKRHSQATSRGIQTASLERQAEQLSQATSRGIQTASLERQAEQLGI